MRSYTVRFAPVNPNITPVTMVSILASALHGFHIDHVTCTSNDVAAATISEVRIGRITTQGTGTANTPAPDMEDDTAFTGTVKTNCTAEPAMSTILASKEWNLATECHFSKEELGSCSSEAGVAKGLAVTLVGNPNPATVTVLVKLVED